MDVLKSGDVWEGRGRGELFIGKGDRTAGAVLKGIGVGVGSKNLMSSF